MSKQKSFRDTWKNQTELGKYFGISAIEVGKILMEHQLKDATTKAATQKAIDGGYAKATPLKDGTQHFLWNVTRIMAILSQSKPPLSQVDYWANEVKKIMEEADRLSNEGQDKLACLMYDSAYDEVPKHIRQEVKKRMEKEETTT